MKQMKTKHALFMSVVSLLLCVAMLAGTTFAWFTDTVTSQNNIIKSGNLDVELYWSASMEDGSWATVSEDTNIFTDTLWEPGHTQVVYLKIVNEGTLALKYQLGVNVASEVEGTRVGEAGNDEVFKLSDYILYGVKSVTGAYASREAARNDVSDSSMKLNAPYASENLALYPKGNADMKASEAIVAIVVYMPEEVGNEANHKTGTTTPQINLGIDLFATQYTYEKDSFDETYDDVGMIVSGYDFLVSYSGEDGKYILSSDFIAKDYIFFGEGTDNTIDLNGNTITAGNTNQWLFVGQGEGSVLTLRGNGTVEANKGVFASSSGTVIVDGGTYQFGDTSDKSHLYSQNSATIVINDGTFITSDANTPLLYCINGFIEINGGFFQNTANPNAELLSMGNNLKYKDNQKITLRGGTFVNWNPMNSAFAMDWPQCQAMIVLADGYEMISETQENGDVWYIVVPAT